MKSKSLIMFLCLAGVILAGTALSIRLQVYSEGRKEYRQLQERIQVNMVRFQESRPEKHQKAGHKPAGLSSLSEQNPDYAGWLLIPGTGISYPFVTAAAPDYYLNHTFSGNKNPCGCIFTLEEKLDWPWGNLVLYGHNMKDGSMFAGLKRYMEESYCHEHSRLRLYFKGNWLEFTVFSCSVAEAKDDVFYQQQPDVKGEKERFLNYAVKRSLYTSPAYFQTEASIVTLSTCFLRDKRIIVLASSMCYTEH